LNLLLDRHNAVGQQKKMWSGLRTLVDVLRCTRILCVISEASSAPFFLPFYCLSFTVKATYVLFSMTVTFSGVNGSCFDSKFPLSFIYIYIFWGGTLINFTKWQSGCNTNGAQNC